MTTYFKISIANANIDFAVALKQTHFELPHQQFAKFAAIISFDLIEYHPNIKMNSIEMTTVQKMVSGVWTLYDFHCHLLESRI